MNIEEAIGIVKGHAPCKCFTKHQTLHEAQQFIAGYASREKEIQDLQHRETIGVQRSVNEKVELAKRNLLLNEENDKLKTTNKLQPNKTPTQLIEENMPKIDLPDYVDWSIINYVNFKFNAIVKYLDEQSEVCHGNTKSKIRDHEAL